MTAAPASFCSQVRVAERRGTGSEWSGSKCNVHGILLRLFVSRLRRRAAQTTRGGAARRVGVETRREQPREVQAAEAAERPMALPRAGQAAGRARLRPGRPAAAPAPRVAMPALGA